MTCENLWRSHVAAFIDLRNKFLKSKLSFPWNYDCRQAVATHDGNAATNTCRQLVKWACSNVVVILCAYEWWRDWLSNISHSLSFRLWSDLITSYRPFLSCCICHTLCFFFLNFFLFFHPIQFPPFSSHCWSLSPWPSCIAQHKLLRAPGPLTAHHCPSEDMLFLDIPLFLPCGWQLCIVGPDSQES